MNLSDQVVSLELAKRLKELGVEQKSLVYWLNIEDIIYVKLNKDGSVFIDENGSTIIDRIEYKIKLGDPFAWNIKKENTWAAFTVAELGRFLQWEKLYISGILEELLNYVDSKNTEADTRAKMLIYLIENKLMEIPK